MVSCAISLFYKIRRIFPYMYIKNSYSSCHLFENRVLVNKNVNSSLQLSANLFPNGKSGRASPEIDRQFVFDDFLHYILTRRPRFIRIQACLSPTMCKTTFCPLKILIPRRQGRSFFCGVQILTSF